MELVGLYVCILAVVIGWLFYKYMIVSGSGEYKQQPPRGTSGWPLIGETIEFIASGYTSRPVSFMEKRKSIYGKVFRTHILGRPIIVSTDPDVNKVVLQNHGNVFIPSYPKSVIDLLGESSILQINGGLQKRLHAIIGGFLRSPQFKAHITKDIENSVKLTLSSWMDRENDHHPLYLQDETKKITFKILVRLLMGVEPGEDMEFLQREFMEVIKGLICLPIKLPGFRMYKSLQAKDRMLKMVRKIVDDRKMAMENNEAKGAGLPNDVIDVLLRDTGESDGTQQRLPLDFISGNIIEMMIPGEDSVPMVMTLAIKYLSDNPVALACLVDENDKLKRKKKESGEEYDWNDYASLQFTQSVISETLRMANIINAIWRKALEDVEIKGYFIPKGWCVLASLTSVHMDEETYNNPDKFDPWRWEKLGASFNSHKFTPFGGGQRLCPEEDVKMNMVATLADMELTDHNKSSLFEKGALDSLLDLVSHGNPRMKETVAKALCNLSSLPKNSIQMIRKGSVNPLVNLLYNHTSSHCLQDEVATIIMNLSMSTMSQNSNETPVLLFESDKDIDSLFSFIGCTRPLVQERLLRSFYSMCHSPLASTVKTKLRQNPENEKMLVLLCENDNEKVRANAVKLFCCITEDNDDKEIIDRMGQQSIETLIKIIQSSSDIGEIASAMGIISNLTQSPQLTELLLKADGLPVISKWLHDGVKNGTNKKQLIENAVGSLCHFTIPTNQNSQKKLAEAGVIPLLVLLLELGTSLTKRKSSISLGQLSKTSFELTRQIPKPLGGLFKCFSSQSDSTCPVHQGICTVETSFCLVEAEAISPLVTLLGDADYDVCEASLDALLTLIEAERLQYGCKVLAEANAMHPIIKLLNSTSSSLQEKVLNALERIFRLVEFEQKYGNSTQMPLVDLTQRGNSRTKSLAARILAQLNVLHDQSSYF